jgi:peroxiredoxin
VRGVWSERPKAVVAAGQLAPDFDLPVLVGGVKKRFRLKQHLAEKNIVLAFYPTNWEQVSEQQLMEYQAEHKKFTDHRSEVLGISVDSIMNTTVWEREIGPFNFPLCSDFWPHGEVSQTYGVFREDGRDAGKSGRALFVVDRGGKVVFSKVYGLYELPPIEDTLEVLRKL